MSRTTRAVVDRGFKAVKMNGSEELQIIDTFDKVQVVIDNVRAVREAVGPNVGIGMDFHGRVHKPMAKVLTKELDPFKLMFIEKPVPSENVEALCDIVNQTSTPIALGERLYSRWDFKHILAGGYVDIIQPDASRGRTDGMPQDRDDDRSLRCRARAALPARPDRARHLSLQIDAVSYNAFIQEQSLGIHYNKGNDLLDYIKNPEVFKYDDGMVSIPQGPGLGSRS